MFRKAPKVEVAFERPTSDEKTAITVRRMATAAFALAGICLATTGMMVTAYIAKVQEPRPLTVVSFDPLEGQVVNVQNKIITKESVDLVTQNYLAAYIVWRESIDHVTTDDRRRKVQLFTNADWFRVWDQNTDPNQNRNGPIATYAKSGMTREIADVQIFKLDSAPFTWRAEFTAIDRQGTQEISRSKWAAVLIAAPEAITGTREQTSDNPIGLTVYNYSLKAATS